VDLLAIPFRGIGLGATIEMAGIAKPPQLWGLDNNWDKKYQEIGLL